MQFTKENISIQNQMMKYLIKLLNKSIKLISFIGGSSYLDFQIMQLKQMLSKKLVLYLPDISSYLIINLKLETSISKNTPKKKLNYLWIEIFFNLNNLNLF